MKDKTSSGIYCIYNNVNGKFYIGSAVNFSDRFSNHKWRLGNKEHPNQYLQNAWYKYHGLWNFQFFIIEYCSIDNLREREQWWLDVTQCFNRTIGYNISNTTEAPMRGTKWTEERRIEATKRMKNFRHTEASKAKMKLAQKDNMTPEKKEKLRLAKIGKPRSEETKRKISLANSTKRRSEAYRENLRKRDKWPHDLGYNCKCDECKNKRKEYMRLYNAKVKENGKDQSTPH